jgi:hypothetical protein
MAPSPFSSLPYPITSAILKNSPSKIHHSEDFTFMRIASGVQNVISVAQLVGPKFIILQNNRDTMKRFAPIFIISNVSIGTGSLNFLARSFVPIANTHRTPYDRRCPSGPFQKNILATRSTGFLYAHSSSPSEDIETVSSDKIIGPELPPIEDSAKRLFLVRHGEVINPGEKRQYVGINIVTTYRACS